jgi:hypothetical protein
MPTQGRGISSALSQIGCILPLTHMHSHAAKALLLLKSIKKKEKKNNFLIYKYSNRILTNSYLRIESLRPWFQAKLASNTPHGPRILDLFKFAEKTVFS